MSVYLYNLLFSLSGPNSAVGRFQPYNSALPSPTIANQSAAWFTYQVAGTPGNLGDYFAVITQALTSIQWGNPQSDANALSLNPGDYLLMRVASTDGSSTQNYQARVTGVFARGTGTTLGPGASDLQSPLLLNTPTAQSTLPRAVIDVDAVGGGSPPSTWPGPIAADGSWVSWLGMVHAAPAAAANDYVLNVGTSVYVSTGAPAAGNLFTFGHDPKMHVGGMMKRKAA
jgi:hypothetical protein